MVVLFYLFVFVIFFSPSILSSQVLAPGDGLTQSIPAYYGKRELWSTMLFGGFPIAADPTTMTWYPVALIFNLFRIPWNGFIISAYVIASSCTYFFARTTMKHRVSSLVSGLIFGMGGFLLAHLGHTTIIHTAAWLPAILLGVEKLRSKFDYKWFSFTSAAIALSILAGHPQIFVYSITLASIYVIYIGLRGCERPVHFFGQSVLALAVGVALAGVLILPMLELTSTSLRSKLTFLDFVSYSLPTTHLILLFFPYLFGGSGAPLINLPYFGKWGGLTEITGYVGLIPVIFGSFGIWKHHREIHARFWTVILGVSILLVLGNATPLAHLIFKIPVFNLFRVPSRHFLEFTLAASILTGLGIDGLLQLPTDTRYKTVKKLIFVFASGMAALFCLIFFFHERLGFEAARVGIKGFSLAPWENKAIGIPLVLTLVISAFLLWWSKTTTQWKNIFLIIIVVLDLSSFGWFYEWHYWSPKEAEIRPTVISQKYQKELEKTNQRMLPIQGGFGTLEELPPNLSRLWQVPSVSGYNPLINTRYSKLLNMGAAGAVAGSEWIPPSNLAIDILSTRFIFLPEKMVSPSIDFMRYGFGWSNEDLGINLDSGKNRAVIVGVNPQKINTIGLVSNLSNSIPITEGTKVLEMEVIKSNGDVEKLSLVAGRDTAEWAWDRKDVRQSVRHRRAKVFESFEVTDSPGNKFEGHRYFTKVSLKSTETIKTIKFRNVGFTGQVSIERISLMNTGTGQIHPVSTLEGVLEGSSRFRQIDNFSKTVVFENLKACPRAWLVPEVISLKKDQILSAIQTGKLPNNSKFLPRKTALVEQPISLSVKNPDTKASIAISDLKSSQIRVVTHSSSNSFLILSDIYYPGWRAMIDGREVPILQTDYVLRGITVPKGNHKILFEYRPSSFFIGAALSITILLVIVIMLVWDVYLSRRTSCE